VLATLITSAVIALLDPREGKGPPAKEELAAITERGRDLAGYDAAAWHASDAVQAKAPKKGAVVRSIARKADKGWMVAFGRMDQARDKFLIAFEATQGENAEQFEVKEFDPPKEDGGFFRSSARAIDVALGDFKGERRPYNVAVLPAEEGQFWVYLVPAPTRPGVWPIGGDARYLVSRDGSKVVGKRRLHKSVIEKEAPKGDPQKPVAGIHTHVLADTPEDTDVFHVLTRKPAVPELIATGKFVFVVEPDGAIKYLGTAEEVLKKK